MKFQTLSEFYTSREWGSFRLAVINDRLTDDGVTICEHCGKPIVSAYDIIAHHCNIYLTEANMNNITISMNPDNIILVHHRCHNRIHNKLGWYYGRRVYLVYGSPLAGKSTYVDGCRNEGDLIVDIDRLWYAVSGCNSYVKPGRIRSNVFGLRDCLLDQIRFRVGKWANAYIIGGYPYEAERRRLCDSLGAEEIFIDTSMDECVSRLESCNDGRNHDEWREYIEEWWCKYSPHLEK